MKPIKLHSRFALLAIALTTVVGAVFGQQPPPAAPQEGIALAIVYDTSGSMGEQVQDSSGKPSPKYLIANRALTAIIDQLQAIVGSAPQDAPRKIEAGLIVFSGDHAKVAVPFGPFNADALRNWMKSLSKPVDWTPLGEALSLASQTVLRSNLSRKHILVLTDGINTRGPDPATVLPKLKEEARRKNTAFSTHFVAFDVDAKVFDGVKKLGATVVGAANEKQLNTQLDFILQRKILLEDEEPAPKKDDAKTK
ncbi:MAG: VWA domain-containing protein [Verrucomicrobiota bacterium]